MLHLVKVGFKADDETTANETLDAIFKHLRAQRNVALDRRDFEQCKEESNDKFDTFYLRRLSIAECADLCQECYESRNAFAVR